jgi:hypothetical protein
MKKICFFICATVLLTSYTIKGQKPGQTLIIITRTDLEKAGSSIPVSAIGEPVSSVKLYPPRWVEASNMTPDMASLKAQFSRLIRMGGQ